MKRMKAFSKMIQERLERNNKEMSRKLLQVDQEMRRRLNEQELFSKTARGILSSVVYPRMRELALHFENAGIPDPAETAELGCVCRFAHTHRFPAMVSLRISLSPDENYTSLTAHYTLEILPMLMEFKRSDERNFPLKDLDREEIGTWVEARIFDFLDTYLQLETHPLYQKDNVVTDPVCGMRFPLLEAVARIERKDETIYFCSEPCKIAYLKKHKDVTTE